MDARAGSAVRSLHRIAPWRCRCPRMIDGEPSAILTFLDTTDWTPRIQRAAAPPFVRRTRPHST